MFVSFNINTTSVSSGAGTINHSYDYQSLYFYHWAIPLLVHRSVKTYRRHEPPTLQMRVKTNRTLVYAKITAGITTKSKRVLCNIVQRYFKIIHSISLDNINKRRTSNLVRRTQYAHSQIFENRIIELFRSKNSTWPKHESQKPTKVTCTSRISILAFCDFLLAFGNVDAIFQSLWVISGFVW
jgi:hypothetical protein